MLLTGQSKSFFETELIFVEELLIYNHDMSTYPELVGVTTPIILATKNRNIKMVRFLLDNGANLNVFNKKRESPLTISLRNNDFDITRELVERYGEYNDTEELVWDIFPYMEDVLDIDIIQYLIDKGMEVDNDEANNNFPIFVAAEARRSDIAKLYLESPIDSCMYELLVDISIKNDDFDMFAVIINSQKDFRSYTEYLQEEKINSDNRWRIFYETGIDISKYAVIKQTKNASTQT